MESLLDDGGRASDIDVAIIGGSFAGLSAALSLVRARRSVVVFDNHTARNRFASSLHGFLGQDGRSPFDIRMTGRREVREETVVSIQIDRPRERFDVQTENGGRYCAQRVILAFGMRDELPDIAGLSECWGQTVNQCPYCHGYEIADRPTGVLMTGPASLHQSRILPDWCADLILFSNDQEISREDRLDLQARGIRIVDGRVALIEHSNGQMSAVVLNDGRRVHRQALYLVTRSTLSCDLATQLGCALTDGPFGRFITVDSLQHTSVAGVYAAGDISRAAYTASWAVADGQRAGVFCHQSLRVAANPYQEREVSAARGQCSSILCLRTSANGEVRISTITSVL